MADASVSFTVEPEEFNVVGGLNKFHTVPVPVKVTVEFVIVNTFVAPLETITALQETAFVLKSSVPACKLNCHDVVRASNNCIVAPQALIVKSLVHETQLLFITCVHVVAKRFKVKPEAAHVIVLDKV